MFKRNLSLLKRIGIIWKTRLNSLILNSKYTVGTVSLIICKKLSIILGNKEQEGRTTV